MASDKDVWPGESALAKGAPADVVLEGLDKKLWESWEVTSGLNGSFSSMPGREDCLAELSVEMAAKQADGNLHLPCWNTWSSELEGTPGPSKGTICSVETGHANAEQKIPLRHASWALSIPCLEQGCLL